MTDYGKNNQQQASYAKPNAQRGNETALMIEGLYNGLSYDLQKMKKELMNELKYTSMQSGAVYESIQKENSVVTEAAAQSAQSMVRELKYGYQQNQMIYESLAAILTDEVVARLDTIDGKVELLAGIDALLKEIDEKLKAVDYGNLAETVKEKVVEVLPAQEEVDYDKITESVAEKTEATLAEHSKQILDAVAGIPLTENIDYNRIEAEVSEKVLEKLREYFGSSAKKAEEAEAVNEAKAEEAEEAATEQVADKFDYDRIIYGAAEKVVESLPSPEKVDYSRIDESFAKATEGLKGGETIDQEALAANIAAAVTDVLKAFDADVLATAVASKIVFPEEKVAPEPDYDKLAEVIAAKMPAPVEVDPVDYDRLADLIIAKMPAPVQAEPIDYDKLADTVIARMPAPLNIEPIDYDKIADLVAAKIPQTEEVDYDRIYQAAQAAEAIPDAVDYDRIAEVVEASLAAADDTTYDLVLDESGAKAIAEQVTASIDFDAVANKVAEKITVPEFDVIVDDEGTEKIANAVADKLKNEIVVEEAPVETATEETTEETTEEVAEEAPVEETPTDETEEIAVTEETTEENAQTESEEATETQSAADEEVAGEPEDFFPESAEGEVISETSAAIDAEIAVSAAEAINYKEVDNQLVDAETGLVLRLKKSFSAKMTQSQPEVKEYYSRIKNELVSYKKVNSTLSWHGDRFNCGRDTIAKVNICGKTLCFYLALDPNDAEYKTTVYHQKDVGGQKAYENTPFMIKIKSDTAVKKSLRLIGFLAEKLGVEKKEDFEPVDYIEAFAPKSVKQLVDDGLIKVTKEKKIDWNF